MSAKSPMTLRSQIGNERSAWRQFSGSDNGGKLGDTPGFVSESGRFTVTAVIRRRNQHRLGKRAAILSKWRAALLRRAARSPHTESWPPRRLARLAQTGSADCQSALPWTESPDRWATRRSRWSWPRVSAKHRCHRVRSENLGMRRTAESA